MTSFMSQHSARLYLMTESPMSGIDVEFLQNTEGIHCYMNVHTGHIEAYQNDLSKAKLTMYLGAKPYTTLVHRLSGGQRLLLKKEDSEYLIQALQHGEFVKLLLEGFEEELPANNFAKWSRKMSALAS